MTLPAPFEALAQDPQALGAWLTRRRWFGAKDRTVAAVTVTSAARLQSAAGVWLLGVLRVEFDRGAPESYFVPLGAAPEAGAFGAPVAAAGDDALRPAAGGCFRDAAAEPAFVHALLAAFRSGAALPTPDGASIRFARAPGWPERAPAEPAVAAAGVEQSNSSIRVEGVGVLKLYRRLQPGAVSTEIEVARHLTRAGFAHTAPFLGSFELQPAEPSAPATALGVVFGWVANRGDAWRWALDALRERATGPADAARDDAFLAAVGRLGRRTAEMHRALCPSAPVDAAFDPEPISPQDVDAWRGRVRQAARDTLERLGAEAEPAAQRLVAAGPDLLARIDALLPAGRVAAMKTRVHGDYHLGQVLFDGSDFHIIDFEGEPRRSVDERRAKESPLKDVAGMLRSFDYAAATLAREAGGEASPEARAAAVRTWAARAREAFLAGYRQAIAGCPAHPADPAEAAELLELMLYDKALYEIGYELANRPDWVGIPVQGVLDLLAAGRAAASDPVSSDSTHP